MYILDIIMKRTPGAVFLVYITPEAGYSVYLRIRGVFRRGTDGLVCVKVIVNVDYM